MKKINVHFLIFLLIAVSVSISDIVIYFLNSNFIITNGIVLLFNIVLLTLLKKKGYIDIKSNFSKFDFIFILGLLLYMIFSIPFPDLSWDTRSYHIYIQENVFIDKLNYDFFAGRNLNSFLFALGDRINYLFRYILGYRLGTIVSYYLILVLFYQVKRFLKEITKSENELFLSIFSIFPCVLSIILAFAGTYYIDNFGLVCLMEIFYILLFEKNLFDEKIKIYILGILVGISISIKVTNIIFIIPIGVYFFVNNFKELKKLKIYDYILIIFFAIIPFGIYALDNFIQTGNPVFPYYNNVFKSEYFMLSEWKDTNFGPVNLIQFLIWPIYIVFYPARAFDTKFVDLIWGLGFIVDVFYIIYCIIKKKCTQNKLFTISMIIFFTYYLWEKLIIGYVRYASIILVLSFIVIISLIYTQFKNKKWISILGIFIICFAILPSLGYDFLVKVKDYGSVSQIIEEYKLNFKYILKDKNNEKVDSSQILGAIGDDSLIPTLLRNDNNIYNLEEWVTATSEVTKDMYSEKILNKEIYVYCDGKTLDRKKSYLENNSFEVLEEREENREFSFLSPSNKMYILKVRKK